MSLQSAWQLSLGFLGTKAVFVEPGQDQLTSDAGLLPIRQFDDQLGLTSGFAAVLDDPRQGFIHSFSEMARSRIYGMLAGYADQNDHDELRYDPVFKLIAGRKPSDRLDRAGGQTNRAERGIAAQIRWDYGFVAAHFSAPSVLRRHKNLEIRHQSQSQRNAIDVIKIRHG